MDDAQTMLSTAVAEARAGLAEGGIPVGAALYGPDGRTVLGRGRNRRVQDGDPSLHAETAAFRAAGRQRGYRGTTMVTTLSPCWYCSGLVRQFGISRVVIGEAPHVPRRPRLAGGARGGDRPAGRPGVRRFDEGLRSGPSGPVERGHRRVTPAVSPGTGLRRTSVTPVRRGGDQTPA